jgi:hypothetical protein
LLSNFEQAIARDCLGPRERDQYTPRFQRASFVRVDHRTLIESLVKQIEGGLLSVDEARQLLERAPL